MVAMTRTDRIIAVFYRFLACAKRDVSAFHAWLAADDDRNLFRVCVALCFLALVAALWFSEPGQPRVGLSGVRG